MKLKSFVALSLLLLALKADAQLVKSVNSTDLVMECMKVSGEPPNKQMVIWFPYDFWQLVGDQMKISPEGINFIVNTMKPYSMFCVVDYTIVGTAISFKSEDEIRKTLKYTDSSNKVFLPLATEVISPDALRIIETLKPVMAKLLGQFGEGMKIFLFNTTKDGGQPPLDLAVKNSFSLAWNTNKLKWKLPLASVLPTKYCPIDNEQMKGNWLFCPEHGDVLRN